MAVLQLVVSQAPCNDRNWEFAGLQKFGRAGLIALAAAALCYTDSEPAQAYKGGGPYGSEVTRGQDLTGKDFSGRTLNKQDFKTVCAVCLLPSILYAFLGSGKVQEGRLL
jgi:hypothetical protein